MGYEKSLPVMRRYWLSCFSFSGNQGVPLAEWAGGQILGQSALLTKLSTFPSIHVESVNFVRETKRLRRRFSGSLPLPETVSRLDEQYVRKVLGLPGPVGAQVGKLHMGIILDSLLARRDDMVGFFRGLTAVTIRASEQAAGFDSPANTIKELRELFGKDLLRLDAEQFALLVERTFTPKMVELKQAFRRECLAAMDTRTGLPKEGARHPVLPEMENPEITHKLGEFYRRNCSLLMGAWDAFGAALVEEAARRGVPVHKPDIHAVGNAQDDMSQTVIDTCKRIVGEKSMGDISRLAGKAVRLIMALPAGNTHMCHQVLAELRKAVEIAPGRAGNKLFALLFDDAFRALAGHADPATALALRCWTAWMEENAPDQTGIGNFDHDTSLFFRSVKDSLSQE